ncbi:MAG: AAA family ATPase [Chlamydiales bacterium]|nr:AAA family ATPase [Chlamydiales bacterium]
MRLKKLKIVGFKSFADKVSIDFDREIIGIVGPNGCGKSNIVDAFRWVMGEQSVKSMRASAMQDVLFAGTSTRSALNYAEVSITLTDVAETLNTPYEEVTITRRLYRNGDSEYRLNKEVVRLRDIQYLFMGSGIGKNAFSIFEQGKIDRVIHLAPQSRRAIFDEAAGIGLFLEKKKETVRKLSTVSDNFHRIRDVYVEVEKQATTLKRQAKLAQTFQENKKRLTFLEEGVLATKLYALREKGAAQKEEQDSLQGQLDALEQEINAAAEEYEKQKEHLAIEEKDSEAKRERLYQVEKSYEVQKVEIKRATERLSELKAQLTALHEEKKDLAKTAEVALPDVQSKKTAHDALEKEVEVLYEARQEAGRAHMAAVQAHEARFLEEEIEKLSANRASLDQEIKEKECSHAALKAQSEELKEAWQSEKLAMQKVRDQQEKLRHRIAELAARERVYAGGEQKLLKAFPKKVRPLLEAIKPKKGCEKALEALLHRYGETLLVPNEKVAREVLAYAEEHKIDNFSLLPVDALQSGNATMATGELSHHFAVELLEELSFGALGVTKEGLFIDHFGVVFRTPFEGRVQLATLKEERESAEKELSALKVEDVAPLEEAWRKIEMCSVQENFALQQLLGELKKEEKEREKLEKKLERLGAKSTGNEKVEDLQAKTVELDAQLKEKRYSLNEAQRIWRELEKETAAITARAQARAERKGKVDHEIEECEKHRVLCEKALTTREQSITSLENDVTVFRAQFEAVHATLEKARKKVATLDDSLRKQKGKASSLRDKLHKVEVASASSLTAQEDLERQLEGIEAEPLEIPLEEAEKEIRQLKVTLEKSSAVNMLAIDEYAEQEQRAQHLKEQSDDLEKAKTELEKIIVKLDQESRKIFKETFELIRTNFQKNFAILFRGGEADLRFTESSDVLEAGIEIVAKPPGKKLRAISLLSGGEKCLTALALLFAIFEVRRAPFCILDEVDAPLDDTNIGRFTEMLRQFTDKTQFIIVTHNKKTMSIADILIGVSMEEKGVSKLLSLAFAETQPELVS